MTEEQSVKRKAGRPKGSGDKKPRRKPGDPRTKPTPEERHTGYMLDGQEILLRKKASEKKYRNPFYDPPEKKVEAAALYTVLGDLAQVSEKTGVEVKKLKEWKEEPWWAEIQKKIMVEQNEGLLAKINCTIEQALAMLEDRILNGDVVYSQVTGDIRRVPVKARDLSQIFHAMSHQRNLMRGDPTQITNATTTDERLRLLSDHFKQLSQGTVYDGEAVDITTSGGEDADRQTDT